MKNRQFGIIFLTLALLLVACGVENGASGANEDGEANGIQEKTIKFSHEVAENTPKHQGALAMKEYIEKESEGKIAVEIYPNSSLFGVQDEYQNLISNNIQFIATDLSKFVGSNPQFNVPSLPFAFDNDAAALAFWDGEKGQEILSSINKDGVVGLYVWPNGGKHITNNNHEIDSPEAFNGLKFRTQGGQMLEGIYNELKAGSESIPFAELYTSLDQGIVDGQENTFSNIESKKFDEVQKYMTVLNHTRIDYGLYTNADFWNSLNDVTKDIIEKGIEEGTKTAREKAKDMNDKAFQVIKERENVEITELSSEQVQVFRDSLQPVWDEYEDEIGLDVYEAVHAANDKYGASAE